MNQPCRLALLAALATFNLSLLNGAATPAFSRPHVPISHPAPSDRLKWDSKKFMHVGELKPGMRGYALTVFKGTKISKFGIEILGVVAKFNEGKDYIMFRALDGPPVTRGLGIAEGMSGSPIYIGGRLVGAISLGDQFAKDPIGFATPIEDMFDAWSPDLPSKVSSISASAPTAGNGGLDSGSFRSVLPLTVSGMDAGGVARLGAALTPYGFNVMAGGGAGDDTDHNPLARNPSLVPGSAVGVALVQGDMDANATGTVTYRDGNRLLLFGHPFQNLGPIDAALTTAYVVDIYPSYQTSFKLGSPIKTVGRIFQDRPFSVGGVIGPMPQMVPMTVSVNDESIKRRKEFHVRIINHPLLTGQFVTAVAEAAIARVHGDPGDSMATVSLDVDAEEIGHIKRTDTFYGALGIEQTAAGDLSSLMRLLSSNPFYPLAVRSVAMDVTIQNRHDTAEIDHLFVQQSKFSPGDTVNVGVVLKPYKRPAYTRMLSVKIPASTPDGSLPLNVQGGGSDGGAGGGLISLLGLLGGAAPTPTGPAANIGQLVKQFVEKPRNNELVARLTLPTTAISIQGEKLSGLPPTLASVMQSNRTTGLRTERDEVKTTQAVPYIVSGSQTLMITVRKKDLTDAARPAAPAPTALPAPPTAPAAPPAHPTATLRPLSETNIGSLILFDSQTAPPAASAPPEASDAPEPAEDAVSPASPSGGDSDEPDTASGGASDTPVKAVGRLPQVWRQGAMADFAAGTLQSVAVTSLGDVRLAPSLQKVADTTENYIWAMVPDGHGNLYLGTGDAGVIYKMDSAGKISPFFKTGELEVTALTMGVDGDLYAGTAPNGRVFRVGPAGKGVIVFTAQEKYITALAYDKVGDQVYIATGGGTGRVYAFPLGKLGEVNNIGADRSTRHRNADGSYANGPVAPPLFTSPEANILSLATDKDGNVYAGSSPDGIVYKIMPDGKSSVFYDATEPSISALATDSQGNVYAGTSPSGAIYRVAQDGTARRLLGPVTPGILSLKTDATDAVYGVTGSTVYRINPDDTVQSYVAQADEQFLSLALDPAASAIYAGTGTLGSVYKIGEPTGGTLTGTFKSTVHDAGVRARWGTLAWSADTPPGTSVALQTRTGDVPRPDESWSAWADPGAAGGSRTVASPPARYIQYQAVLSGDPASVASGTVPRLRDVSLYYLPRNRPPLVSLTKPQGGDAVSKAALIQWTGSDPDKDTLTYDVSYSSDGGKTWTPITKRAVPDTPKPAKTDPARAAESKANLDKQAHLPPAVRAAILAQVKDAAAAAPDDAAKPAQNLKETSFSWDTTEVPDGTYQVQVVASDKPSNPAGSLTAKSTSVPFLIVNAKPTLSILPPVVNADKTVTVRGTAQTGMAFIQAVQGKADGGDLIAASADDGLFDSVSEPWTLTLPALPSGSHHIEVQALDQAGNSATQTVTVIVP